MRLELREKKLPLMLLASAMAACGSSGGSTGGELPWEADRVQVISPQGETSEIKTADTNDCESVAPTGDGDVAICVEATKTCGDGVSSDVVVDEKGEVLDVICYGEDVISVDEIEANNGDVAQNQNNTAIVLDGANDGVDLMGDLKVEANGVVIYGDGPDVSVMSGDLEIKGNNIIVRGIRVEGNVSIYKNNSVILYCVIEGNVSVEANGAHVSGCDIFGDVTIEGNNNVFVGNRIQGEISNTGKNTRCEGNTAFKDVNQDNVIDPMEVGDPVSCGGRKN